MTALLATMETRTVFDGIGVVGKTIFYVTSTAVIGVFFWGWWRRANKYRKGRAAHRLARPARRKAVVSSALPAPSATSVVGRTENGNGNGTGSRAASDVSVGRGLAAVAGNTTVRRRDRATGVAHFFAFWGFLTLLVGTMILTVDYDIVRHATKILGGKERSFFKGAFYLGYSVTLDTMGLAFLIALVYLAVRRGMLRRPQLDYTRAQKPDGGYSRDKIVKGDWVFLGLLAAILVTGFLHEAFRIRASGFPSFEVWSPVGWVLAKGVRAVGIGGSASGHLRKLVWWLHSALALGFVAYIPFSKAMHMVTDVANLAVHDPSSARHLPRPNAEADHIGYRTIGDFTWKELLDLDSCTKCGRCHVVCPAAASGAPLSPRDLVLDLRQWVDVQSGGRTVLDRETRPTATGPQAGNGATPIAGGVLAVETLWACTTCAACVAACPVGVEHVSTIVQLRRGLVDDGTMDPTLQTALQNIAQQGNSFGKSGRMRARWTRELGFEVKDARKEPVDHLWFVGDFASFDERLQELSRGLARIFNRAGVSFGLLYEDEWNAGNDVRRVGEEGLFEMLVEHNVAAFAKASFGDVFTTDPHSFNTLRNEYPEFGFERPVRHYSQLLADLLESGAIPVRPLGLKVTYHDPCYLARYNGVTEAPRRVLRALGCEVVEMPRNRDNTFCCGAGGGRIWMDDSGLSERPSENRIREAATLDVERFVVACPKDFTMYSDAAKTTGHDERIKVVDLVQLVEAAADLGALASVE